MLLDGQPASAALILGGFGLGIAFLKAEFSYTASWRRFLTRGEAGGLLGGLIVIAVAALAVVPVAALAPNFGGAIAPLGPSLLIGAFVFGIGMQLANGCGSGTLYTAGGGSGRMLIALLFFVIGSVFGSLSLPSFLALGGIDPVLASDYLGPWGGLAATLASIALAAGVIVAVAKRRGANFMPSRNYVLGGIAIGLLCIAVFIAGGHPWSVTFGYTVWGAKAASALGFDFSHAAFWQWPGPKHALAESVLSDTSSLTDFGMLFGAMAAAAAAKPFAATAWPPAKSLLAAGDRRPADGLGRAARLRLQYRRLCRRRRLRLAARLGLVCRRAARLPDRHPLAAAVRPVAGVNPMRTVYIVVVLLGLVAIVGNHLDQPVERPRGFAGGFRRRLRALRRALSVEEIAVSSSSEIPRPRRASARPRRRRNACI